MILPHFSPTNTMQTQERQVPRTRTSLSSVHGVLPAGLRGPGLGAKYVQQEITKPACHFWSFWAQN